MSRIVAFAAFLLFGTLAASAAAQSVSVTPFSRAPRAAASTRPTRDTAAPMVRNPPGNTVRLSTATAVRARHREVVASRSPRGTYGIGRAEPRRTAAPSRREARRELRHARRDGRYTSRTLTIEESARRPNANRRP